MRKFLALPLRRQIVILVVLALVPSFVVACFIMADRYIDEVERSKSDAKGLINRLADQTQNLVASTKQLLESLSTRTELKEKDVLQSTQLLKTLKAYNPLYMTILASDGNGRVFASSAKLKKPLDISDRGYFKAVMTSANFSIGNLVFNRIDGKPTLHFASPILDDDFGWPRGIVACALDLAVYGRQFQRERLMSGSFLAITDSEGNVVYRQPGPRYFGKPLPQTIKNKLPKSSKLATYTLRGLDGVKRWNVTKRLALGRHNSYIYITVGIPTSVLLARARQDLLIYGGIASCIAFLALLGAVTIGNYAVGRKVTALVDMASKIGDGDMSARTGFVKDGTELGLIATTLDEMADAISLRERLLRDEKEHLAITLRSLAEGVITTDAHGCVAMMNGPAEDLTGWNEWEALGCHIDDVFSFITEAKDGPIDEIHVPMDPKVSTNLQENLVLTSKCGVARPIEGTCSPVLDSYNMVTAYVIVIRDVTDRKRTELEMKEMVLTDRLTGLRNRLFAEIEIERLSTSGVTPLTVIMGDLNGLKLANDALGHSQGDMLLQRIASVLRLAVSDDGFASRWGGDEFLLVLPGCTYLKALSVCREIKNLCQSHEDAPVPLSIALGTATRESEAESLSVVLRLAEERMYHSKLMEGRSARSSLIVSLRETLAERTHETAQHSERMRCLALEVGTRLGLSSSQMDDLALLAVLHDIGKIGIPDDVLLKAGPLTPEEWERMKQHPAIGFRIARSSYELSHISDSILAHHERWNGTGYPQGLAGEDIPLIARIVSVIDAFDVMVSGRPYKRAMTYQDALAELARCSGSQFDPLVVEVFSSLPIPLEDKVDEDSETAI